MLLVTIVVWFFFFNETATTVIYTYGHTLSLHDALPISRGVLQNLIGYDEDGKIRICAGGRRYRALKLLLKAKAIPGTFEVPVEIRSKDEALEIRSEEHTSELQSLMRISYAVFCLKKTRELKTSIQKHTNPKRAHT